MKTSRDTAHEIYNLPLETMVYAIQNKGRLVRISLAKIKETMDPDKIIYIMPDGLNIVPIYPRDITAA